MPRCGTPLVCTLGVSKILKLLILGASKVLGFSDPPQQQKRVLDFGLSRVTPLLPCL
jgi:hypothetical protein